MTNQTVNSSAENLYSSERADRKNSSKFLTTHHLHTTYINFPNDSVLKKGVVVLKAELNPRSTVHPKVTAVEPKHQLHFQIPVGQTFAKNTNSSKESPSNKRSAKKLQSLEAPRLRNVVEQKLATYTKKSPRKADDMT